MAACPATRHHVHARAALLPLFALPSGTHAHQGTACHQRLQQQQRAFRKTAL